MKIAFYCSNEFPYPCPKEIIYPPLYPAYNLVEGLVKNGHDVYLFGSKNNKTKAKNISKGILSYFEIKEKSDYLLSGSLHNQEMVTLFEQMMASIVLQEAKKNNIDIIHFFSIPRKTIHFSELTDIPILYTNHDSKEPRNSFIFKNCPQIKKINFNSISFAQRKTTPEIKYFYNVYNGIDLTKIKFSNKKENFLIWVGRICPEKGTHTAIKVAKKSGTPLKIIGPKWNKQYFESFEKEIDGKNIQYLGTLSQKEVFKIIPKAKASLVPIQWEEPFGLTMIESLAAGTPVIAFDRGSVSEIIQHKKTGFIVKDSKEMIQAVKNIDQINNYDCRKSAEKDFSLEKMVDEYEKLYKKIINKKIKQNEK